MIIVFCWELLSLTKNVNFDKIVIASKLYRSARENLVRKVRAS